MESQYTEIMRDPEPTHAKLRLRSPLQLDCDNIIWCIAFSTLLSWQYFKSYAEAPKNVCLELPLSYDLRVLISSISRTDINRAAKVLAAFCQRKLHLTIVGGCTPMREMLLEIREIMYSRTFYNRLLSKFSVLSFIAGMVFAQQASPRVIRIRVL
jgi:hypothetical protein